MIVEAYPSKLDLDTLRFASQVCKAWRNIILSSSSIWALLVNLDFFTVKTEPWLLEVLRRTGESPLHIEFRDPHNPLAATFLQRLLYDNWHRVELLSLALPDKNTFDVNLKDLLRTCAPLFREFRLHLTDDPDESMDLSKDVVDFGNYAPVMHSFDASSLKVQPTSSWISNLRVWAFTIDFPLPHLVEILSNMPQLEDLSITSPRRKCIQHTPFTRSTFPVPLPRLRMIRIVATARDWIQYVALLEYIQPEPGYYLEVEAGSLELIPSTCDMAQLAEIMRTYLGGFKEDASRDAIHLRCPGDYRFNIWSHEFSLTLKFNAIDFHSDTIVILKSFFYNTLYWKHVTEFGLNLCGSAQSRIDSTLPTFIWSHLNPVTRLRINGCHTLRYISECPTIFNNSLPLFPQIKTLLVLFGVNDPGSLHFINDFLQYRIDIGRPIRTLVVYGIVVPDISLTSLDRFTGLKVVIETHSNSYSETVVEYVCGSGNPEVLALPRNIS